MQNAEGLLSEINNMFHSRFAAAREESKQLLKLLLRNHGLPRYSDQQDSLCCYVDQSDLIREYRKNGVRNTTVACRFLFRTKRF